MRTSDQRTRELRSWRSKLQTKVSRSRSLSCGAVCSTNVEIQDARGEFHQRGGGRRGDFNIKIDKIETNLFHLFKSSSTTTTTTTTQQQMKTKRSIPICVCIYLYMHTRTHSRSNPSTPLPAPKLTRTVPAPFSFLSTRNDWKTQKITHSRQVVHELSPSNYHETFP